MKKTIFTVIILAVSALSLLSQIDPDNPTGGRPRPGYDQPIRGRNMTPPDTGMTIVTELFSGRQPVAKYQYFDSIPFFQNLSSYTPPTYTQGSVLFADVNGITTEENSGIHYKQGLQRLIIGSNTEPSRTGAGLTLIDDKNNYEPAINIHMSGIDNQNSQYTMTKGRDGGVEIACFTNQSYSYNQFAFHESAFTTPGNALSELAAMEFFVQDLQDRSRMQTNRPNFMFATGNITGSNSVSQSSSRLSEKVHMLLGTNVIGTEAIINYRGGTYTTLPPYRSNRNNYNEYAPDNIAYFSTGGTILRSTPNQLQVTDPISLSTVDLSVALASAAASGGGGTDLNGFFTASNNNATIAVSNVIQNQGFNWNANLENFDIEMANTIELVAGDATTTANSGFRANRFLVSSGLPTGKTMKINGTVESPSGGASVFHSSNTTNETVALVLDADNRTVLGGSATSQILIATQNNSAGNATAGAVLQLSPDSLATEYTEYPLPSTIPVETGKYYIEVERHSPDSITSKLVKHTDSASEIVYSNNLFTEQSPMILSAGDTIQIDWSNVTIDQTGWTGTPPLLSNRFFPDVTGSNYLVRLQYKAKSDNNNAYISQILDIGATTPIIILERSVRFPRGTGVTHPFSSTDLVFTRSTFKANGAAFKLYSGIGNQEIFDISLVITKI